MAFPLECTVTLLSHMLKGIRNNQKGSETINGWSLLWAVGLKKETNHNPVLVIFQGQCSLGCHRRCWLYHQVLTLPKWCTPVSHEHTAHHTPCTSHSRSTWHDHQSLATRCPTSNPDKLHLKSNINTYYSWNTVNRTL